MTTGRIVTPIASPKHENCSQKIWDIEVGRLLTLTGDGSARWKDTNGPIAKQLSLRVTEVIRLKGARAAVVKGLPVNANGEPRKNSTLREIVAPEGSFIVWW